jgi:adenylylsulfate kinase
MGNIGFTLWFTGLPCSGKSSIADGVFRLIKDRNLNVERLDGDIIRKNLWRELGFSKEDRNENIRRVVYLAKMLARHGIITITSFISPYQELRDYARQQIGDFVEIYVKCPINICMQRDTRDMYRDALAGKIKNFTGISDPYEEPPNPEILIESDKESLEESIEKVISGITKLGYIRD